MEGEQEAPELQAGEGTSRLGLGLPASLKFKLCNAAAICLLQPPVSAAKVLPPASSEGTDPASTAAHPMSLLQLLAGLHS